MARRDRAMGSTNRGGVATVAVLRARLLGGFAVLHADETDDPVPWERYDTTAQVLKFLLLQPRLRCHHSVLINALWPDADGDKAVERLYFHVKRLRTLLQPDRLGITGGRLVMLDKMTAALAAEVFQEVDVHAFTAAATAALARADFDAGRAALALYRGALLPDDLGWMWLERPRRELAARYHALLEHTARLLHAAGDVRGAIALLTDLLTRDHCHEPAARLLMACYDAQGERAAAARVYHTLRVRLQDELHVLPGPRTEELYASIRRAPVTPTTTRTVLPAQRRRQPRPTELHPPLGREDELARAEHVLDDVRQRGGGYTLFVQGEAGVGKTYVAHEILNRARRRGFTVLVGAARAGGAAPYAPLIDALRARVVSVPTQTLRAVLAAAPGVAALLPEVAAHREFAPAVVPQDTRLQRDVAHALATVCAGQPTALLLDDLHDADEATLAVVRDLVWMGFPAGLLLLATLRTEPPLAPAVQALLSECRRQGSGETLRLSGLPPAVAPAYLAATLDCTPTPQLATQIHAKAGGNPFLMAELAREVKRRGLLAPRGSSYGLPRGRLPVPESVRELTRARLDALPPDARRLAALAAVAGTQPVAVLAQLGRWAMDTTLDLLDHLVASGLFEEREGYRFRHEVVREAVYEVQSVERRAFLHARVAEALEQRVAGHPDRAEIADLAYHYERGGPAVAAQAAHYAQLAGDQAAALYAHHDAAAHYRAALEHAPEGARADLYERLGTSLAACGEHSPAIDALQSALSRIDDHDDHALPRARVLWRLGAVLTETGAHTEAAQRLAEAAVTLSHAGGTAGSDELALLHGRITGARSRLAVETGDLDRARDLAGEAIRLLEAVPEAIQDRLDVRNALAGALYYRGRLDEAEHYLEEQLPDAEVLGYPDMLCRLHANRGLILLLKGQVPAALAANDLATKLLGDYHDPYRRAHLLADRLTMYVEAGAWDDALVTGAAVVEAAEPDWPHLATRAHATLADVFRARGQLDEAREHLERCIAAATAPGFDDEIPLIMALVRRAAIHRLRGQVAEAMDDVERARAAAERSGRPEEVVDANLEASALCGAQGDDARAGDHARIALDWATRHGFTLYRGRALVALARATTGRDPTTARALLDEAIALLQSCGAQPALADALALRAGLDSHG